MGTLSVLITLIIHYYTIGNIPEINIGVINHNDCSFINKIIDQNIVNLVPYNSTDQAFKDSKANRLSGFVILPSNVTETVYSWIESNNSKSIEAYLDQTEYHKTWFIKVALLQSIDAFSRDLNMRISPISIEPLFGPIQGDYKKNSFPSLAFL
jgi:ABC-2 family transporter protein